MPASSPKTHSTQEASPSATRPSPRIESHQPEGPVADSGLTLQQSFGNRALQRMLQRQAQRACSECEEVLSPVAVAPPVLTTSLPNRLKTGVEALSGISMDSVKVHYNSPEPARVEALAYTQGTDIHVASGQEKHLAHEAWHVVQQQQGRVRPTTRLAGTAINDDSSLEREADSMGAIALAGNDGFNGAGGPAAVATAQPMIQRYCGWSGCNDPSCDDPRNHSCIATLGKGQKGETRHIMRGKSDLAETESYTTLKEIYEGSEQVRYPRSYEGERPKQILRWLASVIFDEFGGTEIQCYWDTESKTVWVSSNTDGANKNISKAVNSTAFMSRINKKINQEEPVSREARHSAKLFRRQPYDEQTEIKNAMENDRIMVPGSEGKKAPALHAERRIEKYLGRKLDPTYLAGVKRPCLVCARALELAGARPGPLWPSFSAMHPWNEEESLEHALANGIITHVTYDRVKNELTTAINTDSDTDYES